MHEPKKHLTTAQTVAVAQRLGEVLERVPTLDGSRKCKYRSGDDASIAAEFGVGKNSVMRVRSELYGNLFHEPKERPASGPSRETLQRALEELAASHCELAERYNKLITTLALARVAEVKHLAVPADRLVPISWLKGG
jgi:hypothetical protein